MNEEKNFKQYARELEKYVSNFSNIIGIIVIIALLTLIILTVKNFDKQNQIIETGGFIDGKIKCVCSQEAWDRFQKEQIELIAKDMPNITISDG